MLLDIGELTEGILFWVITFFCKSTWCLLCGWVQVWCKHQFQRLKRRNSCQLKLERQAQESSKSSTHYAKLWFLLLGYFATND